MSHGLVALGSAAVLTVYTAGYARTRDAADQLDAAQRHRPVVPAPAPVHDAPIAAAPTPAPIATPAKPRARELAPRTSGSEALPPIEAKPVEKTPAEKTPAEKTPTEKTPAEKPPVEKTPSPVATPVEATPTPAPSPAAPPAPKWFDGSFTGWGRSRHGDIQATVAIENGKITYVAISICDTRYPCDVIAKLPGQVLERQSPEVDFVAGATESTNAFYYAVVEALKKAK